MYRIHYRLFEALRSQHKLAVISVPSTSTSSILMFLDVFYMWLTVVFLEASKVVPIIKLNVLVLVFIDNFRNILINSSI